MKRPEPAISANSIPGSFCVLRPALANGFVQQLVPELNEMNEIAFSPELSAALSPP